MAVSCQVRFQCQQPLFASSTHFLTICHPCLDRDPYFGNHCCRFSKLLFQNFLVKWNEFVKGRFLPSEQQHICRRDDLACECHGGIFVIGSKLQNFVVASRMDEQWVKLVTYPSGDGACALWLDTVRIYDLTARCFISTEAL